MTNLPISITFLQIVVIFISSTQRVSAQRTEVPPTTPTLRDANASSTVSTTQFHNSSQTPLNNSSTNNSNSSGNAVFKGKSFPDLFKNNSAILRAVYVACGIVVVVILYNLIMTRLRRKKNKFQLYGVINSKSDIEMTPLEQDDDEETTMFDARDIFKNTRS